MTLVPAGTEVSYTVTYLEMDHRPTWGHPSLPVGARAALIMAEAPPAWYFLSLYDAVGRDYAWEDMHAVPEADLQAGLDDEDVELYTLFSKGWPQGFFLLDWREKGICDLAYFGLVPESVGQGLGTFLLRTAILTAWERDGVQKMTVNTNTLDHPRALQHYQKNGFAPVRREDHTRVLQRDRDLARIPE